MDPHEPRDIDRDGLIVPAGDTPDDAARSDEAADVPAPGQDDGSADEPPKTTRRNVLRAGGILLAGAAVGGVVGYQVGGTGDEKKTKVRPTSVKIGAVIPKGSPYLGQGQESSRGLELAVKKINDRGGLNKKDVELVLQEVQDLEPGSMQQAANALVGEEVLAVFLGFTSPTCEEFAIYGEYGAPVFHLSGSSSSIEVVSSQQLTNIFRCLPSPIAYGARFAALLQRLAASGDLEPRDETVAVITVEGPDGVALVDEVTGSVEHVGWTVASSQQVQLPVEDWEGVLDALRGSPPDAVFLGIESPEDLAGFQQAFSADPFPSLLFATFGPSVPEYLDLAAETADGVVWSTPIGTIPDAISEEFRALYEKKFNRPSGLSQAGAQFDMCLFWAQCAAVVKSPTKFSAVEKVIPEILYRGVSGTINLQNEDRVALGFPGGTRDPGAGLPHLTFQIQGDQQALLGPAPFPTKRFIPPSWL